MIKISEEFPLIMIKRVSYSYPNGTAALKAINLTINRGEVVAIMGKNGAGKTTLIRTLNGLIRPLSGIIYLNQETIADKSIATISKHVGIIFQNPSHQLFANNVEDEIKFSLKSLDLSKEEIQIKINQILRDFNLEKYRERSPLNLSGGESKKLAVASIICRDPEILIFDEPTLGQDAREIEYFVSLINQEKEKGKTIIIITHNVEFAFEFIPRTILMSNGRIIADGPTEQVLINESIIERASLVLPQIRQFILALQEAGFTPRDQITSIEELINYLKNIIKNNIIDLKEE